MIKKIGIGIVFVLGVCFFVGCMAGGQRKMEYPVTRVSVILPDDEEIYWNLIRDGIVEQNKSVGKKYNIDVRAFNPQIKYNVREITDLLEKQIVAQVDVVVVQGNGDEEFRKALQSAYDLGIKIICVDTDMENFPEHLYIGTDNYAAGKLMGEELIKLTGGEAKIAVISGEEGYSNLAYRLEGFEDAVENEKNMEIKQVVYDYFNGLTFMELYEMLSQTYEVDTLVNIEGSGSHTLEQMYSGLTAQYDHIIGFDIEGCIEKNIMDGVVKQDAKKIGQTALDEIVNEIVTGTFSKNEIFTPVQWITKDNYEEVMNESK